jgi:hypothetical protein
MALMFLGAALRDPPLGVAIEQVDEEHDLGSYPTLAVLWGDGVSKPNDFIRSAEHALAEFEAAIDWSRIRPSNFWPDPGND